jgi:CheY-like chemotaxis protein
MTRVRLDCGGPGDVAREDASPDRKHVRTILLVDDDESIRFAVGQLLEVLGYRVITASGGEDALRVFTERVSEIAAVVLDLTMPVMSGADVLRGLRRIEPRVKVLLSSGHERDNLLDQGVETRSVAFLKKPYLVSTLQKELETLLESR